LQYTALCVFSRFVQSLCMCNTQKAGPAAFASHEEILQ
jgi:hypothetical protein